jgi:multidrug efflux pump subunit AcrB
VVILITVFSAMILGLTIDRVSLFALIFSIGILVDDAIVVVENIYRRWLEKGEMDTETAVDAVREVGNPTILATFTVIAALLPMGFVSGMMGPYMAPIPTLGSVAMLFSLFAAFAFTPWLVMRLRPSMEYLQQQEAKEHAANERLEQRFRNIITPIVNDRKRGFMTLGVIVGAFFLSCAFFYTNWVTVKMLPLDNKPEFSVTVDMPEGTALPQTANLASRLAEVAASPRRCVRSLRSPRSRPTPVPPSPSTLMAWCVTTTCVRIPGRVRCMYSYSIRGTVIAAVMRLRLRHVRS